MASHVLAPWRACAASPCGSPAPGGAPWAAEPAAGPRSRQGAGQPPPPHGCARSWCAACGRGSQLRDRWKPCRRAVGHWWRGPLTGPPPGPGTTPCRMPEPQCCPASPQGVPRDSGPHAVVAVCADGPPPGPARPRPTPHARGAVPPDLPPMPGHAAVGLMPLCPTPRRRHAARPPATPRLCGSAGPPPPGPCEEAVGPIPLCPTPRRRHAARPPTTPRLCGRGGPASARGRATRQWAPGPCAEPPAAGTGAGPAPPLQCGVRSAAPSPPCAAPGGSGGHAPAPTPLPLAGGRRPRPTPCRRRSAAPPLPQGVPRGSGPHAPRRNCLPLARQSPHGPLSHDLQGCHVAEALRQGRAFDGAGSPARRPPESGRRDMLVAEGRPFPKASGWLPKRAVGRLRPHLPRLDSRSPAGGRRCHGPCLCGPAVLVPLDMLVAALRPLHKVGPFPNEDLHPGPVG